MTDAPAAREDSDGDDASEEEEAPADDPDDYRSEEVVARGGGVASKRAGPVLVKGERMSDGDGTPRSAQVRALAGDICFGDCLMCDICKKSSKDRHLEEERLHINQRWRFA